MKTFMKIRSGAVARNCLLLLSVLAAFAVAGADGLWRGAGHAHPDEVVIAPSPTCGDQVYAHLVFETATEMRCGPAARSLTSGRVALLISSAAAAGGSDFLAIINRFGSVPAGISVIHALQMDDGFRAVVVLWDPAGERLLVGSQNRNGVEQWHWLDQLIGPRLNERELVYSTETVGDTRPAYSPCFGADGQLYSSEWQAREAKVSTVRTQEPLFPETSLAPGGMRLIDRRLGAEYTLFVDGSNNLILCWCEDCPATTCRLEARLFDPVLFVRLDEGWRAAQWRPDARGDLRLPGVPASFDSELVSSGKANVQFIGRVDDVTVLVWVARDDGGRLIAVRHAGSP